MIFPLYPPLAKMLSGEMSMDQGTSVCSMTDPICSCVEVSQKEIDEFAEAAIKAPLLAREIHPGPSLPGIDHWNCEFPVDASRQ